MAGKTGKRTSVLREDLERRRGMYRLAIARSDLRAAQEIAQFGEKYVPQINELSAV
jgi:hypothetical protein